MGNINNIQDVINLRNEVCQNLLTLYINPGWQFVLFDRAEKMLADNKKTELYGPLHDEMLECQVDGYEFEDLSFEVIYEIMTSCPELANPSDAVRSALTKLYNSTNITAENMHSAEKEELYLMSLLDLCHLKTFVRDFEKCEPSIDEFVRHDFVLKSSTDIETLKKVIDSVRLEYVRCEREIDDDIQTILYSNHQLDDLNDYIDSYRQRYVGANKDYNVYYKFMSKLSDAGIIHAHHDAAIYSLVMNNNISDGENRLLMMLDSYEDTPFYDIRDIIYCMNEYLKAGNKLTDTMHDIISRVKGTGCSIELTERGILKFV